MSDDEGSIAAMNSLDCDTGVESPLIDLGAVSFTAFQDLDNATVRRALRHVVAQAARARTIPRRRSGNAGQGGERID